MPPSIPGNSARRTAGRCRWCAFTGPAMTDMKPVDVLYFDDATPFTRWLAVHHVSAGPQWVAIAKKGCTTHVLGHRDALDAALCFGWIDGIVGRLDGSHYALRFSRRRARSNWSVVNLKRYRELAAAGRVEPAGRQAYEARDPGLSEETPAALSALERARFKASAEAWSFFERQPPGYRRQASWYGISATTAAVRARRLERLIDLSSNGQRLTGFG